MKALIISAVFYLTMSFAAAVGAEEFLEWPRDVQLESGVLTAYQPQVDALEGDVLTFRAAVAYRGSGADEPVFGAVWMQSRAVIDRDERVVHMSDLRVTGTRFPAGSEHVEGELETVVGTGGPGWNFDISLDALLTSLEVTEQEMAAAAGLKVEPPRIIYRDHPALLIYIDGDPALRAIENSKYQAVVNTPYPLVYDGRKYYYLNAAVDVWFRATEIMGPWSFEANPPADVSALVDDEEGDASQEKVTAENAPEIIVTTEPAELLVTEGAPDFQPLVDDLLVLKNSQSDVFLVVTEQNYYIVLSGRWYHSKSLQGPWAFRPSNELPDAFTEIPPDSQQADSRVYVAGTDEAREAVMDAQIPQTATVQKGPVDIEVSYDGDPKFAGIEGTELARATNTSSTVIRSGTSYYLVQDAVWYIASSPAGPWRVAEERPEGVESIPPQDPAYNVKYVYIYDSTPEVVYVGYTPGYTGSYVYYNTVVYGTGWYYHPWISPYYYYPRHATWGFHVTYNPWTGWGYGLSWGWGPFRVGYHTGGYWHRHHYWGGYYGGAWGPAGYRPAYRGNTFINTGDININAGNRVNVGQAELRNTNLYKDRAQKASVTGTRDFRAATQPVARDRAAMRDRVAGQPGTGALQRPESGQLKLPSTADKSKQQILSANDVYTDTKGNVYRKTDKGWQTNTGRDWSDYTGSRDNPLTKKPNVPGSAMNNTSGNALTRDRPSATPYQRPSSGYSRGSSLDRQDYSRQRAAARSSQYQSRRPPAGSPRRR
jgi:hypothetical protein